MSMFLVRQAIYNRDNSVFAYDLLFDECKGIKLFDRELEEKRISFICNYGTLGLNKFTNNKKAVVGFTKISLCEDIPDLLGKDNIIIKLPSDVEIFNELKQDLERLRKKDFVIAIDCNGNENVIKEYSDFVDIVIIDFAVCDKRERKELYKYLSKENSVLAKSIDTKADYEEAISEGVTYLEGNFFSKPIELPNRDISIKNSNRFNLIIQLLNDDIDVDKIEHIIKSDLSISYKLVRFLNSPVFGFVQEITSIRQAIVMLGKEQLRKWLTLVIVSDMNDVTNEEITNNTIIRARFCEVVAEKVVPHRKSQAFLTGMFSELDVLMDTTMDEVLSDMQIESDVKMALLGKDNILRNILNLVVSYEKMEVKKVETYSKKLDLDKGVLFDLYSGAIDWLNDSMLVFNK